MTARFASLDRLRMIGSRRFGKFRLRHEEGLGNPARAQDLLAIIAARLALLLRAVEQDGFTPRSGGRGFSTIY